MGQFSWLDCTNNKVQILDDYPMTSYVLVPIEFGGGKIEEPCYNGYGDFGGNDIYDLIADWNREYLVNHPNYVVPSSKKRISDFYWYSYYADLSLTREEVRDKIRQAIGKDYFDYRLIGIDIACYDEDNEKLPYSIKVTYSDATCYEWENPSPSDPNQGWFVDEDFADEDDDWW